MNHDLGNLYNTLGRFSDAERSWNRAVELSSVALKENPISVNLRHVYASQVSGLADALRFQSRWPEAEKAIREAIRLQETLAVQPFEQEDLAWSLCQLGFVLHHLGQSTEEEEVLLRSIRISMELINSTPKLVFRRVIVAEAMMTLAALDAIEKT